MWQRAGRFIETAEDFCLVGKTGEGIDGEKQIERVCKKQYPQIPQIKGESVKLFSCLVYFV